MRCVFTLENASFRVKAYLTVSFSDQAGRILRLPRLLTRIFASLCEYLYFLVLHSSLIATHERCLVTTGSCKVLWKLIPHPTHARATSCTDVSSGTVSALLNSYLLPIRRPLSGEPLLSPLFTVLVLRKRAGSPRGFAYAMWERFSVTCVQLLWLVQLPHGKTLSYELYAKESKENYSVAISACHILLLK